MQYVKFNVFPNNRLTNNILVPPEMNDWACHTDRIHVKFMSKPAPAVVLQAGICYKITRNLIMLTPRRISGFKS